MFRFLKKNYWRGSAREKIRRKIVIAMLKKNCLTSNFIFCAMVIQKSISGFYTTFEIYTSFLAGRFACGVDPGCGPQSVVRALLCIVWKSGVLIKVPLNRKTFKTPKTWFSILHCWEAFQNLIAGSLPDPEIDRGGGESSLLRIYHPTYQSIIEAIIRW